MDEFRKLEKVGKQAVEIARIQEDHKVNVLNAALINYKNINTAPFSVNPTTVYGPE
jgi:hypothetical protein